MARPLPVYEQITRWAAKNRLLAAMISLLTVSFTILLAQTIWNEHISRQQNQSLSTTLNLLRTEKERSDDLLVLAEKNELKFRELAWNSTMRECLTAMGQKQFRSAWVLLEKLRRSHPENIHRPEWQLTFQELGKYFEPRFDAGHPLYEIAAIPGTALLAVAGDSYCVDLVNSQTFQREGSILTDVPAIHAIAVSADGKCIAVGGAHPDEDSTPIIYSLETGERLQTLSPQMNTIESLMFSPDGQHLVCGSRYKPVRIFNLHNGTEEQLPTARRNHWFSTSPDGTEFAALAEKREIVISAFDDPKKSRQIHTQGEIEFCIWIPETRVFACTNYQSEYIELINIDTGNPVGRFLHSGPRFSSLAVSRLHQRVFAGGVDGSVVSSPIPATWLQESSDLSPSETGNNAIEALTMTEVAQLDDKPLEKIVISDTVLYCCSASGRISAFHFPEFIKETIARIPFYAPWASAEISLAGDVLVGKDSGTVVMRAADLTRPTSPASMSFSEALERGLTDVVVYGEGSVHAITNSPDQQFVGLARRSGEVELSELLKSDTRILRPGNEPQLYSVDAICFSPDSQRFAWTGKEKQLFTSKVSETNTFHAVQLTGDGRAVQYSPDSSQLACGGSVDPLTVFDCNSMKPVRTLNKCAGCTAIAWNRSGESLLLGFIDGSIQIRALSEDNSIECSCVHRKEVVCIALSPDGSLAVSVDDSGQIAMWDAQTGEVFGVLFEPAWVANGIVEMKPALRFLASGKLILVFDDGHDGPQIHRWSGLAGF